MKFSAGWIDKFKKQYNIRSRLMSGEAGTVDPISAEEARKSLIEITKDYAPCDIYNADETGLMYK